jgi:CRP-like cAMP-binding protein
MDFVLASLLENLPVMRSLNDDGRRELTRWLRMIPVDAGDVIFRQGERGGALLWVLQGIVRLEVADHTGRSHGVCNAQPGELIGELSFGEMATRANTAIAASSVVLAELTDSDLNLLERRAPLVASRVLASLTMVSLRRLRHINRELDQRVARHVGQAAQLAPAPEQAATGLARLWGKLVNDDPEQGA